MKKLLFTATHEWVVEEDKVVLTGITQHAQELLGDLVYIELPEIGTKVQAGDELGVVESVKAAADFYAPVSGEVIAINEAARQDPALVNDEPHGAGWLVKLKPDDLKEIEHLMDETTYQNMINESH